MGVCATVALRVCLLWPAAILGFLVQLILLSRWTTCVGMGAPDRGSADAEGHQHEVLAWLALATIEGVGYWTLKRLSRTAPSWKALLNASTRDQFLELVRASGGKPRLRNGGEPWQSLQDRIWAAGKKLFRRLSARSITLLLPGDPLFPLCSWMLLIPRHGSSSKAIQKHYGCPWSRLSARVLD